MIAYFILVFFCPGSSTYSTCPNLMRNFKTAKFIFCLAPLRRFLADQAAHFGLADGLEKRLQLRAVALGEQLHPAIIQIAHCAGDLKTRRHRPRRVTEPDALDSSGVVIRHTRSFHPIANRQDKAKSPASVQRENAAPLRNQKNCVLTSAPLRFGPAMATKDKRVDAYIANAADFAKPILNHLRRLVHAACPDVEEDIKWSHVAFLHRGMLANMAAFKAHCGFGFWKGILIFGSKEKEDKFMGRFGRITCLADLPSDEKITRWLK